MRSARFVSTARRAACCCASAFIVLLVLAGPARGQCEVAKLVASDGEGGDRFAFEVDLSGDVAVLGAYSEDQSGLEAGAAYVYRFDGTNWIEEAKLLAYDGAAYDGFGSAVAVDGDLIVVGATWGDGVVADSGAAYVYRFDGARWYSEGKLEASDGAESDRFGGSVAVLGDVIVIGAEMDNDSVTESGSAYIFRKNGVSWQQEAKLTGSNPQYGEWFGCSVSICGAPGIETVAIGAKRDETAESDAGAVHVFRRTGGVWIAEAELTASDAAVGDLLGSSCAITGLSSGECVVTGAIYDDDDGDHSGSVYVFQRVGSVWTEEAKLTASDADKYDMFGISVSIDGSAGSERLLVGAYGDAGAGPLAGAAYVFRREGDVWTEETKLLASDMATQDYFGYSVSLSGETALVGAYHSDENTGAAYIFGGMGDCNGNGAADCADIMTGASTDYDGNVTPDECELLAYNLTAQTAHAAIEDALHASADGDRIAASPLCFDAEADIDFLGRDVTIQSLAGLAQPAGGLYELTNGARLETADGIGMTIGGELRAAQAAAADLRTASLTLESTGQLICRPDSFLALTASYANLYGVTRVFDNATFTLSNNAVNYDDLTVYPGGEFTLNGAFENDGEVLVLDGMMTVYTIVTRAPFTVSGGTIYGDQLEIEGGRLNTAGSFYIDIWNDSEVYCLGDTLVVGQYLNFVTTVVQVGTLTIVGDLYNSGTIIGDVQGGKRGRSAAAGDGVSISGTFSAGVSTSLMMPDAMWRLSVGGDYDAAINDNTNYDMALATLRMDGLAGSHQALELMSEDIGPDPEGLDRTWPGHYPIGTLRLSGTMVECVDVHDNDGLGQESCEALYVDRLIIDSGTHVATHGCRIYYNELTLNGTVDDEGDLVPIEDPCPWDTAPEGGDGTVGLGDLNALLSNWGPCAPPCPHDFAPPEAPDGVVGLGDLNALLSNWGPCPPGR
jgi:hypothetical protein